VLGRTKALCVDIVEGSKGARGGATMRLFRKVELGETAVDVGIDLWFWGFSLEAAGRTLGYWALLCGICFQSRINKQANDVRSRDWIQSRCDLEPMAPAY